MSIVMKRDILVEALETVGKVVSQKPSLPILKGYCLKANEKQIVFMGSNGDESIIHSVQADDLQVTINEPINFVAPNNFLTIIKKLGEEISLKLEGERLIVESGKSHFELNGLDADEYPKINVDIKSEPVTMGSNELKDIVHKTAYAASTSETRPILQGVHFHLNGQLSVNCTDSFRLARLVREGKFDEELQAVVPAKALQSVAKIIDGNVQIYFEDNQVIFRTQNTIFMSRLLEGNYPEVDRLIPSDYKTQITLDRQNIIQAIERVDIVNDKNGAINLDITNEQIELSTSQEVGQVSDQVESHEMAGESLSLACNGKYVLDVLKRLDGDKVVFNFTEAMKAFTITSLDVENELNLVLPIRQK